jgi:hypothetical protein
MSITSLEQAIARNDARRRVAEARFELGGLILGLLRSGEERVLFDDPRIKPALVAVEEAEKAFAALPGDGSPGEITGRTELLMSNGPYSGAGGAGGSGGQMEFRCLHCLGLLRQVPVHERTGETGHDYYCPRCRR